ncbi:MAG: 50S ribosomal protein L23 [Flavobacteriales bacterium]|nr:50S ribosomal protein L23 [Flavobacteriales bacterium]|tara:strand:+ start:745 stop:1035 length:291 start_codon:yes stop_codon:yes gene_type:complete
MSLILKPIITEKMTDLGEKFNRYGFIVEKNASKNDIKNEVESIYGVKVEKIRTMIYAGKSKSRNTKSGIIKGRTSSFKKAIIDLSPDDSIDFYNNV